MLVDKSRRAAILAAVVLVVGALLAPVAAHAAESGDVTVTATINSVVPLSITLCDTTAAFGTNLDAAGTISNSPDPVSSIPGDAGAGEGAFYQWAPNCGGAPLITVQSGDPWSGTVCASAVTGDSGLALSDLRFSREAFAGGGFNPYGQVSANAHQFSNCGTPADWLAIYFGTGQTGSPGSHGFTFYYYLQVDRTDLSGSFSATTTWAVSGG